METRRLRKRDVSGSEPPSVAHAGLPAVTRLSRRARVAREKARRSNLSSNPLSEEPANIKTATQGDRGLISGLIEGHCANAEFEGQQGEKMFWR